MPTRIFLCGMPGSGKTTLGKNLAAYLTKPFYDLDDLIEARAGQTVRRIFETKGEAHFRKLERDALQGFIESERDSGTSILSLGGGTPCFYDNMQMVVASGVSIFLNTPLTVIKDRMMAEDQMLKRPLLSGASAEGLDKELLTKYQERLPFYDKAHLKIKGDESLSFISLSIDAIADKLSEGKTDSNSDSGFSDF
ncbi:MAG: shikimate kinase [Bacteroidota bacterium]